MASSMVLFKLFTVSEVDYLNSKFIEIKCNMN